MSAERPIPIVMMGTDARTRGGIAAVLETYRVEGLFARWPIHYIATHCDGSRLAKAVVATLALFRLLAVLARHSGGVLHVHSASRASFWRKCVYMACAHLLRWRVIFHLHGGGFARFFTEECGPVRRAVARFFLDRADRIVVVSETWARWMATVTSNRRISCIHNPVSLVNSGTQSELNLPEFTREPGLVAFVGRCEAGKGIFDLLEAANLLRGSIPQVRLECAGDGDLAKVARYAIALNLGTRVSLPGWVDRAMARELMQRASVFVLPSYAEAQPVSLLEAMAAGCPVIATSVGGIPDVITDEVDGLLVPPGNPEALAAAISRVLREPAFARSLGNAARETIANRYAAGRSLERLEQLYAGLGVRREAVRKVASAQTLQEIS
ncbi:MAG TPA: glycosyltransferase family 4 protein [Usitatibacter sp.]|jgi:glycosyltransferase involved in cell wall biosynthesis|nr:glycosyltransferase family 4 protein [Usitatibacter sp.]